MPLRDAGKADIAGPRRAIADVLFVTVQLRVPLCREIWFRGGHGFVHPRCYDLIILFYVLHLCFKRDWCIHKEQAMAGCMVLNEVAVISG